MKYPLPYGFARENQLLLEDDGDTLTLVLHPQSARDAVGEVLRKFTVGSAWSNASVLPIRRASRAPRWWRAKSSPTPTWAE
jgi:general secretion pathway protein E